MTNNYKIRTTEKTFDLLGTFDFLKKERGASNRDVDSLVIEGKLREVFRTATPIVNEAPNKPFGEYVRFEGLIFIVPREYQNIENCALSFDPVSYSIEYAKEGIVLRTAKAMVIEKYPKEDGSYFIHRETGIPHGNKADPFNKETRRLYRAEGSYIGFLVRNGNFPEGARGVYADYHASGALKVAYKASEK